MDNNRVQHIKSAVSRGLTLLLVVTTAMCFVLVVKTAISDDVSLFGYRLYYVSTGSMEPTIPTGSLVVVKQADAYEIGDVITYISRDDAIYGCANTHRIIGIAQGADGTQYQTQGDANGVPDALLVPEADVIGKVAVQLGIFKWVGYIVFFMGTRWGFLLLIICPLLYVTVSSMRDFIAAYKAEIKRMAQAQLDHEALEEQLRQNPAAAALLAQQGIAVAPPTQADAEHPQNNTPHHHT